jgi:hypothetical protein
MCPYVDGFPVLERFNSLPYMEDIQPWLDLGFQPLLEKKNQI